MRILVIHNLYQIPGGEDRVLEQESSLLTAAGHDVRRLVVSNESLVGALDTLRVAWRAPYSEKSRELCRQAILEHRPQVAHVHNLFPILTPSVLDACEVEGVPTVMTLHNYRLMCAGATFTRQGRVCTDCLGSSPYKAVLHRCYRDSFLGSLASARVIASHRRRGTWSSKVQRFIALTEFGRNLFVEAGLPADRVCVKPNFCDAPAAPSAVSRRGALFAGRLSREKGIATLLGAWEEITGDELRIAGGPSLDGWGAFGQNVKELGQLDADAVQDEMRRASFLVMPSEWFEGFPMTLVEAFSQSLPVLASRLGAMAEIVTDGQTGLHFEPGDALDLAEKAKWLFSHPEECRRMGDNARVEFERRYTPERNYRILLDIYQQAIEELSEGHG